MRLCRGSWPPGNTLLPCCPDALSRSGGHAKCGEKPGRIPALSAPVRKSSSSAGLMSSSPMGGDAVKNSIEVSKFFAILAFSCSRCERHSLLGSCPWRELSEAFALRASLGLAYRDDLAGPIESRQGTRASRRTLEILSPLLPVPVDGAGGSSLGLTKVVRPELDPARLRIVLRS